MDTEIYLNDFAIRSFRDIADKDYITARMTFRAKLFPQFLWSGQQAIEKYLKCILLLNRIKAKDVKHNLGAALALVEQQAPFNFKIRASSQKMIEFLDTYGRFRYLETPFHVRGDHLHQLDMTIWDIRRYCMILSPQRDKQKQLMESFIKYSEKRPACHFRLISGVLENILDDRKHPAREALVWKNLYFGLRNRQKIKIRMFIHGTNSPLSLNPEILDAVFEYIYLPPYVIDAYRKELALQSKSKR